MRKPKKYELITSSRVNADAVSGTIVYEFTKCDYGLADDDTRLTGMEHRSVTLEPSGDYPSFTHTVSGMREIKE